MYRSPMIASYTGQELLDLMGPVETQYVVEPPEPPSCDISNAFVNPEFYLPGKPFPDVCFDIGECEDFETVTFSLFDSSDRPRGSTMFSVSNGNQRGDEWCVNYNFGNLDPGEYTIEIVATDSNGISSNPIEAEFTVIGAQNR